MSVSQSHTHNTHPGIAGHSAWYRAVSYTHLRLSYGMKLWKEDDPKLPMLPIKEYENQVADGADGYCILGRMANDYKKLIHPVKKYQRER